MPTTIALRDLVRGCGTSMRSASTSTPNTLHAGKLLPQHGCDCDMRATLNTVNDAVLCVAGVVCRSCCAGAGAAAED
jgi:hypothetical protein